MDEARSRQMSRLKGLFGPILVDGLGQTRPVATLMKADVIALYFGASRS
eukprot:SAG31_NODE_36659_length_311_cov_0.971698_1_plen_48_part_01